MGRTQHKSCYAVVVACVADARRRAEEAIHTLDELEAPPDLIEAVERSRDELEETQERLAEYALHEAA